MASNRKLPFGYRMELGKIAIHPEEAPIVQHMFQQYILGASYTELVEDLRRRDVPYNQGKLWNKNMVARILENRKYIASTPYWSRQQSRWTVRIIWQSSSPSPTKSPH